MTWIGLSSVTHSFNTGQRFLALQAVPSAGGLAVTAPASPDACPPGHYLMFLVTTGPARWGAQPVTVTGPLVATASGYRLQVRTVAEPGR